MSDVLGSFVNDGLSPEAMKVGFAAGSFMKSAGDIADVASLGTHVNKLIGHIKPGMFKEGVDVNQLMDEALTQANVSFCTRKHFGRELESEKNHYIRFAYSGIDVGDINEGD